MTSELGCISFMILLVTIITSSEVVASSLIAKYTICRSALCSEVSLKKLCLSQFQNTHVFVLEQLCSSKKQSRRLLRAKSLADIE